jgi:acetyltransferase-like isoleucine patch superfamily enzyme
MFSLLSRGAFYEFGRGSVILLPIRLGGESKISIGRDVYVGAGSWLQTLKHAKAKDGPVISLGDGTAIAGYCTITGVSSVVIEPNVLIARYCYIADHVHASADRTKPILAQGIHQVGAVRIGEGAWLGQSVVICAGVTIGKGAVVGANSIVRQDVPDFCIAAGAPAKILREVDRKTTR